MFPGGETNSIIQCTKVEGRGTVCKVKSKSKKVLENLEGDNVNPAILHNSKIDIAYNPMDNRNIVME